MGDRLEVPVIAQPVRLKTISDRYHQETPRKDRRKSAWERHCGLPSYQT